MWLVTTMRAVDAAFWRRNASYAIVAIVIFGAILTPDGSGITMWLVAGPMIVLYSVTYLLLRREDQSFSGGHRKQAA
jgi:sec-independent protein translocase protein TatC